MQIVKWLSSLINNFGKSYESDGLVTATLGKAHSVYSNIPVGDGGHPENWKNVAILVDGPSASVSYFILPFLKKYASTWSLVSAEDLRKRAGSLHAFDALIVVRYLPSSAIRELRRFKTCGGEIVYFMDDDLFDANVLKELPTDYAKKIAKTALRMRKYIDLLAVEYLVSTEYLARKYVGKPVRVLPIGLSNTEAVSLLPSLRVFYHGSASHEREMDWLVDVVAGVQARTDGVHFEFIGDIRVNRRFRHFPRVTILHPMSWKNYLSYTSSTAQHVGLAPLLPSQFNAGRGPTKFLDFSRMGAVGLYSDVDPYRGFIGNNVDGVLLPNDKDAWIDAIVQLAANPTLRDTLAMQARRRAFSMVT